MAFRKIEWTDEIIEEFWRYWSERPDAHFSESLGHTIVRFTKKRLGNMGTALDFGAGSGGLLAALSHGGIKCYGLDLGNDTLDKLSKRFVADDYIEGFIGIGETPQFINFFDTVFLIETIEHLPDRHLNPSIESIISVLKPGGWLVVSTPNDENLESAEVYCPVSRVAFHPMQHVRSWNTKKLIRFLLESGFIEVKCVETDLQALPYHSKSEAMKRALKRLLYRGYKDPHLIAFARKPYE